MAITPQDIQENVQLLGKKRRRREQPADERTLVSPVVLRRPSAPLIYWTILVVLLVATLSGTRYAGVPRKRLSIDARCARFPGKLFSMRYRAK